MQVINEHDEDGLSSGTKAKGKLPDILVEHLKGLAAGVSNMSKLATQLRLNGYALKIRYVVHTLVRTIMCWIYCRLYTECI